MVDNPVEKRSTASIIMLLLAGMVFFGTWIEVAINTGFIGVALGWVPGLVLSYIVILCAESK